MRTYFQQQSDVVINCCFLRLDPENNIWSFPFSFFFPFLLGWRVGMWQRGFTQLYLVGFCQGYLRNVSAQIIKNAAASSCSSLTPMGLLRFVESHSNQFGTFFSPLGLRWNGDWSNSLIFTLTHFSEGIKCWFSCFNFLQTAEQKTLSYSLQREGVENLTRWYSLGFLPLLFWKV